MSTAYEHIRIATKFEYIRAVMEESFEKSMRDEKK